MQWSRIGLVSVIMMGFLSCMGVANAGGDEYSYNGVEIRDIPVVAGYGYYYRTHHMRHHHRWHHYMMYHAYHVCKMYTYEITPQHRDVACSKWVTEWKPMHWRWHRYYSEK